VTLKVVIPKKMTNDQKKAMMEYMKVESTPTAQAL
jgi:hypothetical protein